MKSLRLKLLIIVTAGLVVLGCGKKAPEPDQRTGFGISAVEIGPGEVDLSVYLNYPQTVKGIEFMLSWNSDELEVKTPVLLPGNETFSVHARSYEPDRMKVLVFSMQGDAIKMLDGGILKIPVRTADDFSGPTELAFLDPVFAGPNATSYDIPVENGIISVR